MTKTKALFFDFGGCLDSDGIHSRTLFFNAFLRHGLPVEAKDKFQNSYTLADLTAITQSLLIDCNLLEMNKWLCAFISDNMKWGSPSTSHQIANDISMTQGQFLKRNKPILEILEQHYQLAVVSNFTGNLQIILDEFSLLRNFKFALDSYHVGVSKPDKAIFQKAIELSGLNAETICFIGDNLERDIAPSKALGMKTVIISKVRQISIAEFQIKKLPELLDIF